MSRMGEPGRRARCTSETARWCPLHGECTCSSITSPQMVLAAGGCALHSIESEHARDVLGRVGEDWWSDLSLDRPCARHECGCRLGDHKTDRTCTRCPCAGFLRNDPVQRAALDRQKHPT